MGKIYRTIELTFWTDSKIVDDFTPEDKYFYLYLLTNPHTNICGCYEISIKQMARETGYNEESITRLLKRMEEAHDVIRYSASTKEVLILNWHRYNWTKSADLKKGVLTAANSIKNESFRTYICEMIDGVGTVHRPSIDGRGTSVTVTNTDTVTDNSFNNSIGIKHHYGEYSHVLLTDDELAKLQERFPDWEKKIKQMDEGIELKGYKYKSHYLAILKWAEKDKPTGSEEMQAADVDMDTLRRKMLK